MRWLFVQILIIVISAHIVVPDRNERVQLTVAQFHNPSITSLKNCIHDLFNVLSIEDRKALRNYVLEQDRKYSNKISEITFNGRGEWPRPINSDNKLPLIAATFYNENFGPDSVAKMSTPKGKWTQEARKNLACVLNYQSKTPVTARGGSVAQETHPEKGLKQAESLRQAPIHQYHEVNQNAVYGNIKDPKAVNLLKMYIRDLFFELPENCQNELVAKALPDYRNVIESTNTNGRRKWPKPGDLDPASLEDMMLKSAKFYKEIESKNFDGIHEVLKTVLENDSALKDKFNYIVTFDFGVEELKKSISQLILTYQRLITTFKNDDQTIAHSEIVAATEKHIDHHKAVEKGLRSLPKLADKAGDPLLSDKHLMEKTALVGDLTNELILTNAKLLASLEERKSVYDYHKYRYGYHMNASEGIQRLSSKILPKLHQMDDVKSFLDDMKGCLPAGPPKRSPPTWNAHIRESWVEGGQELKAYEEAEEAFKRELEYFGKRTGAS